MNNQILLLGGRPNGRSGFLSIIRYGLKIRSYLSVNITNPLNIWIIKRNVFDKYHSYLIIYLQSRKTITFYLDGKKLVQCHDLKI